MGPAIVKIRAQHHQTTIFMVWREHETKKSRTDTCALTTYPYHTPCLGYGKCNIAKEKDLDFVPVSLDFVPRRLGIRSESLGNTSPLAQLTPSLRCRLVEDVVYWKVSFLLG